MFVTDCTACGLRELRGPRSIELLVNTDLGPEMVYRCTGCSTVNALSGHQPSGAAKATESATVAEPAGDLVAA